MRTYWLRLFPQQPLMLDDPLVVPGRAIRGALAAVLKANCVAGATHESGPCNSSCNYWPVFGLNAPGATVRIGDAHAAHSDDIGRFPSSARTCRLSPGFLSQGGHGMEDTAIRSWVFEQAISDVSKLLRPYELRCTQCGAALIPYKGLLVRGGTHDWRTERVPIIPILTHHRRVHPVFDDQAFVQRGVMLGGGGYYVTRMEVPETLDSLVHSALAEGLVLGGGRTRGMGFTRAELLPRPDSALGVRDRIADFNRALRTEQRFYAVMAGSASGPLSDDGAWYFTLDVTDAQTSDRQPTPLAETKALRSVTLLRSWTTCRIEDGRSTTGKRPGARKLLSGTWLCRASPEADRAALEQALAYLETHGLGLGAERGYGSVSVCDPFHLELDPL